MDKLYVLILMFAGILMSVVGYYRDQQAPRVKTIYKFIESSIDERKDSAYDTRAYNDNIAMFENKSIL